MIATQKNPSCVLHRRARGCVIFQTQKCSLPLPKKFVKPPANEVRNYICSDEFEKLQQCLHNNRLLSVTRLESFR